MRRLIIALILVLLCVPAYVGAITAPTLNPNNVLLQNNYICDENAGGVDLLCGLVGYWRFDDLNANDGSDYDGSSGQVKDRSGQSSHPISENRILNSEDMEQASWAGNGTVVSPTTTSDISAVANESTISTVLTIGGIRTWTAYMFTNALGSAPAHYPALALSFTGGANTTQVGVVVDAENGTIVDRVTGGTWVAPDSTSITGPFDINGTDMYRITVTGTANAVNTEVKLSFFPAVNTNAGSGFVAATQGITQGTRFQLTGTTGPVDYVATTGTAVANFFNNGRAVNGAFTNASGKLGRGGGFANVSGQYIDVPNTIGALNAITFSSWFYPISTGDVRTIIGTETTNELMIRMQTDRKLLVTVTSLSDTLIITTSLATLNAWNHFAYVWDGASNHIWINGVKEGLGANTGSITFPDTFFIGQPAAGAPSRNFDGRLDEPKIWKRALNDAEFQKLYNGGRGHIIQ